MMMMMVVVLWFRDIDCVDGEKDLGEILTRFLCCVGMYGENV